MSLSEAKGNVKGERRARPSVLCDDIINFSFINFFGVFGGFILVVNTTECGEMPIITGLHVGNSS